MKRFVATLALLGAFGTSLPQAQAQDWYGNGYPVQPASQEQYPVLKKVLIGGALFGAGFLAGRLTAPKQPQYPNYQYQEPNYQYPQGHFGGYRSHPGHGYGRSIGYQPGQVRYGY